MSLKIIEHAFKRWLRRHGVHLGKKAKPGDIQDFFKLVRPVTTEHELIRVGDGTDGGYLLPNDLDGIKYCFSPGVSLEAHFDLEITRRGITTYLADNSVDHAPSENSLMHFDKKHLGIESNDSHITLDDWVASKVGDDPADMILQMDIEGNEYEVLFDTSNATLKRFRIIVIEFHDLDYLVDRFGYKIISLSFRKLLKNFHLVHIHPNNCSQPTIFLNYELPPVMEFTFLRKDRVATSRYTTTFPHKLDIINVPHNRNFILPDCWYRQPSSPDISRQNQ